MDDISRIPFKFRLGEITLGSIARRMVASNGTPFIEATSSLDANPASGDLPMNADGFLFRSAPVSRRLPRIQVVRDWIRYVPHQYQRYFADLRSTYDEYLNSFSSKSRSTLRRKVRRFEKESGCEVWWKRYQTPDEMRAFYDVARDVSRDTYQERLLDAGLPASEEFRSAMNALAEEGNVRGYVTFVESRAAAFLYCPIRDGVVSYAYLGYRPEFERLSPGTVLLWVALEDLFMEGKHSLFDFTEGGDAERHSQKRFFATGSHACADIYFLRPTLGNLALVGMHAGTEWCAGTLGSALERLGIKRAMKRFARRFWPAKVDHLNAHG